MSLKKVAVIGTGFIGMAHIDALSRVPGVTIAAICDAFGAKEKAEKLGIPAWYDDYKKMIDELKPDAVHICTPNNTHFEIAMYAVEHGVNVVCEKPFTTTIKDAETLVAAVKKNGVHASVNLHNRFYPMPNQMKRMIDKGELGDVFSITGGYVQDWLQFQTDFNWRLLSKNAGSTRIVGDIGSHWIDLAQFVTGHKVVSCCAEFQTVYPDRINKKPDGTEELVRVDTEDMAAVLFRFDNGALGSMFVTSMLAGRKNKTYLTVAGKTCSAEWDSEDSNALFIGYREKASQRLVKDPTLLDPLTAKLSAFPGGHVEGFPDAFANHFKHFYSTFDDPSIVPEYASFEDGLYEMKVLEAIFESSQKHAWVDVK